MTDTREQLIGYMRRLRILPLQWSTKSSEETHYYYSAGVVGIITNRSISQCSTLPQRNFEAYALFPLLVYYYTMEENQVCGRVFGIQ